MTNWLSALSGVPSLVLAHFAHDGRLVWANAGFRRLHDGDDERAWLVFAQPTLEQWFGGDASDSRVVFSGMMTARAVGERMCTLVGEIRVDDDGVWILAGYDMDEFDRATAALLDLNAALQQTQRELARANRMLRSREAEIVRLSLTDPLTGTGNRRGLEQAAEAEAARFARHGVPLTTIFLDLDHFKRVNDTYGHEVGDAVLRSVGKVLGEMARKNDYVGRFGGEEFVMLLPETSLSEAMNAAERLRARLAAMDLPSVPRITASLGVAQWQPGDDAASAFARADQALLRAKQAGRNRVEAAT